MTSCTIIISHYESESFLHQCIKQIRKYAHPEIKQHIIIVDQSSETTLYVIARWYDLDGDITIIPTNPHYSGYGIDCAMRYGNIETDYICQLHTDCVPIHPNWLYLPIKLIEENNFSFVGQLQVMSKHTDTIYPPVPFFAMAQSFNVAKTEIYKEMSIEAGFTRFHERQYTGLEYKNNDWFDWAAPDYKNRGSDDDVIAFAWEDKYREHDKLGLAISGYIQPSFGRIIDDLVFHFCSARESVGVIDKMPEFYQELTKRIDENYDDDLLDYMVEIAQAHRPPELRILSRNHWDGKLKVSNPPSDELNKRIEELKNE